MLSRAEARACCAPIWDRAAASQQVPWSRGPGNAAHEIGTQGSITARMVLTGASPACPLDADFHQDAGPGGREEDLDPVLK